MLKNFNDYEKVEAGGEWIVVPTGEGVTDRKFIIRMNETASDIWDCIYSGMDSEQIVDFLMTKYEVDRQTAQKCVGDIIAELEEKL